MENQVARVVGNLKSIIDNEEAELKQRSGLDTSMGKDEIKDYLEQVIDQVQKGKNLKT